MFTLYTNRGGITQPVNSRKGGKALILVSERLPEGGQRREGEVTHRG